MRLNKFRFSIALLFIPMAIANSGEFHNNADVLCGDCHTTHYSERGQIPEGAEPGGPFLKMLMIGSIDHLCLSCHDGTDPAAPDILAPVNMYSASGSEYSAAGFFTAINGNVSEFAHDLGTLSQTPYSLNPRSVTLSCTSCHEPHGNGNYRNLIIDPDSSGVGIEIISGADVFQNILPANPPDRSITIEAYKSGNIGYRSRLSEWCIDCHSSFVYTEAGSPPAHFQEHPVSASLGGAGYHIESSHWIFGTGEGFGLATGDAFEGIPRLRFQSPGATDFNSAKQPALSNELNCATCHLAHGGDYKSGMIWPYKLEHSADMYSGCQQCHIK